MTVLNMDAPTADQLDIPVQAKKYRDVAKGLEEAPTWQSKMMGVMIAGLGMLCFLAHTRLGGGANLSCTCLYLTLIYLHEHGYDIGYLLRILLDNTTSENKCNEVIFFICWLVQRDNFVDSSFFCMLKGHTYTGLDRTFNTMFMFLKQIGIYTISALTNAIFRSLQKHDCLQVVELHALWDWTEYFKPHVSQRLGGFATSQHGSGMHEFYARKDSEGVVRLWMRKSSQASGWMPEGPRTYSRQSSQTWSLHWRSTSKLNWNGSATRWRAHCGSGFVLWWSRVNQKGVRSGTSGEVCLRVSQRKRSRKTCQTT